MPVSTDYRPAPLHSGLGEAFFDEVAAASFPKHELRFRNHRWAERVGLGSLSEEEWTDYFGKFSPLPDNLQTPLSLKYHGHQFQVYNPDLGDGRGFLFAQLHDVEDGRLLDLGTKGSGQTPYSRMGDGRLTLKGGVREVLATEMLEALGVYTSKTFSLIETGEALDRNDEPSPTRSAVMVRLSHSHIRFGTFQRLAFHKDTASIEKLIDYAIANYFPTLSDVAPEARKGAFLREVTARTARLAASWMAAGFVHGVLNTDNMNITGESFDYGPYRFAPLADGGFTAAYFDGQGLYAYGRQAPAVAWNLSRLGGAIAEESDDTPLNEALQIFPEIYQEAMVQRFHARLGVQPSGDGAADLQFVSDVLQFMGDAQLSFEHLFFDWFCGRESESRAARSPVKNAYVGPGWEKVSAHLRACAPDRPERLAHDYFQRERPVTLLIDEIETLWARIAEADDWSAFEAKLRDIAELREAHQFQPEP